MDSRIYQKLSSTCCAVEIREKQLLSRRCKMLKEQCTGPLFSQLRLRLFSVTISIPLDFRVGIQSLQSFPIEYNFDTKKN